MTHTANHTVLLFLGQLVGWLGVSIAIYLQVINPRRCEPKYFWGFLTFGFAFIIAHVGWFETPMYLDGWLPALGYFILIGGQLYAAWWVYKTSDLPGVKESMEYALKS